MKLHSCFLPALTLIGLFTTGPALAMTVDLADNLSELSAGTAGIDNINWTGQQFHTTGSAYTITYVAVPLSRDAASSVGNFELDIFDDSRTTQVAVVINSPLTALGTTSALFEVPNLNIVLSPSTSYYLVLKGIGLEETAPGMVYWDYTDSTSGIGFPSGYVGIGPEGSGPDFTSPQQMHIQAASVPEPATFSLLGIGLAATCFVRRRTPTPTPV